MNLLEFVEAGDAAGVLRALAELTPAQRAAHAEELAAPVALAEPMADDQGAYTDKQRGALRIAELGCLTDPRAAADWLLLNQPRDPARDSHPGYDRYPDYAQLMQVANLYPPDWRAELVARLADPTAEPGRACRWYPLAERIIRDIGCPTPTTDRFINAWMDTRDDESTFVDPGERLLDLLREDDLTPTFLPLAIERARVPLRMFIFRNLRSSYGLPRMMESSRIGAFISLSAEGAIDRDVLIRRVFADLSGSPSFDSALPEDAADVLAVLALTPAEHAAVADDRVVLVERLLGEIIDDWRGRSAAPYLAYLRVLAPTAAENARFVEQHMRLLAVNQYRPSSAAVVGYVQEALLGVDEAGLLEAETFTELSERLQTGELRGVVDFRMAGFVSRLAAGKAIDRAALISRIFGFLNSGPNPSDAAAVLRALELSPAEHAEVSGDRVRFVEPLLASLLQEEGRKTVADLLAYLSVLAPTAAENAGFLRQYMALLDRSSTVAGYAQEVLLGMDEAGLLEADTFTEMSERVLLRAEKKLVRSQLTGLDRTARRDPARAARLMIDAATAFQHQDPALQERALDVVARHRQAADDAALPELRAAAEWLSPAFSARAAELFGSAEDPAEQFVDLLPEPPEPRPVQGPATSAAEVAHEVAAVVAGDQNAAAFERALDGLVRHAHADREGMSGALKPVMRRKPAKDHDCRQADLYDVARAVRGEEPREFAFYVEQFRPEYFSLAGALLAARLTEAIEVIESGAQPFLLAVPTLATGALDADVLIERLARLEELGIEPAPVDLAQALFRVTPTTDARTLSAAEELHSEAGHRLARWLRDGGLPHQDSEPKDWDRPGATYSDRAPARPGVTLDRWFPPAAAALVGPYQARQLINQPAPFWVAQLPHHRDEMLARDYPEPFNSTRLWKTRILPLVAEADGPAGYAVYSALAYGIALSRHGDGALDAMLVLAAREQLDTTLLGRHLGALLKAEKWHTNGVRDSLQAAAETGAYGVVWAVLETALPYILRDGPIRGAAAFLSLAADCASRCGAKGEIPGVVAIAERGGSSQTVKNAKLLRDTLR